MNERNLNFGPHYSRLTKRRQEIAMTLEHLRDQRQAADENPDWLDESARNNRINLLGSLTDWYVKETVEIDQALRRMAEGKYGICTVCQGPIESARLDAYPAAALCLSCQKTRPELAGG